MIRIAATARSHDVPTGSGTLLLDDGTLVSYSGAAFSAGGLRVLRSGQRVTVDLEPDGATVSMVTLPGLDPT